MIEAVIRQVLGDAVAGSLSTRMLRLALAACAVGAAVAAVFLFMGGSVIFALLSVALAALCAGALFILAPATGSVEVAHVSYLGSDRQAFVFPFTRSKALVGALICGLFAAAFAFMVVASFEPPLDLRGLAIAGAGGLFAAMFAAFTLNGLVTTVRGSYLALLRDGLLLRAGLSLQFVPWSAVTGVGIGQLETYGRHRYVYVRYTDAPEVRVGWGGSLMRRIAWIPGLGASTSELRLQSRGLTVPDSEIAYLTAWFHANPAARGRIGSAEGLRLALES